MPLHRNSFWLLLFPIFSALFYTLCNAFMRQVAGGDAEIIVAVAIKESVAFYIALPIYLGLLFTHRATLPPWKYMVAFFGTSLLVQLLGNVFLQQSFRDIGMATGVAGSWVGSLLTAPFLGVFLLHEKMSKRVAFSLFLVIAALFLLTSGVRLQSTSHHAFSNFAAIQSILLCVVAGMTFAASNCMVRTMNNAGVSMFYTMFFLPGMGAILLALLDFSQHGTASYATFSSGDLFYAYMAGVCNAMAYVALILGLRYLSLVRVCIINVSQLALAPLVGFLVFGEPVNGAILLGISFVILGIVISNTTNRV